MFNKLTQLDKDYFFVYTKNIFVWNIEKSQINYKKHNVTFEEASTIFFDPNCLNWEDVKHSSKDEKRFKRIGTSNTRRILITIYTVRRSTVGEEKIRIISARQASRKERNAYTRC